MNVTPIRTPAPSVADPLAGILLGLDRLDHAARVLLYQAREGSGTKRDAEALIARTAGLYADLLTYSTTGRYPGPVSVPTRLRVLEEIVYSRLRSKPGVKIVHALVDAAREVQDLQAAFNEFHLKDTP